MIAEAFERVACDTLTTQLGIGSGGLVGAQDFVDDGLCAVNLVPGLTYAEGSLPDPAGSSWVLLLRGPSVTSALPAQTIAEFVAGGGEALSIGSSSEPFGDDFPVATDEAAGFAGFVVGDGAGVMTRQNESLVSATWNGVATGDRSLRFIAAGQTETAVVVIISEVARQTPIFSAR